MARPLANPPFAAMKPSRWRIDAEAFRELRFCCGLDIDRTARLLHVAPRTVRRWESGRSRVPYSAFKLLRLIRGGELPGKAWEGFRIAGDTLWSPEGKPFKAHELGYLWLTFASARAWREAYRERCRIERLIKACDEAAPEGTPLAGRVAGGASLYMGLSILKQRKRKGGGVSIDAGSGVCDAGHSGPTSGRIERAG
ncbi:MAG: VC1465 family Xer recombination activation factor [Gammaproteobacteria bacterium]